MCVHAWRNALQASGQDAAAAVAFLATIAKDYGYADVAVELLKWAADGKPNSASYALNLVHAHEVLNDYESALEEALPHLIGRKDAFHLLLKPVSAYLALAISTQAALPALPPPLPLPITNRHHCCLQKVGKDRCQFVPFPGVR